MNENECVTIIMPVHNGGVFVSEAIKSVINQSYTEWKLLIIDDGSTDNTFEIITQFNDDRVRVIRNNHCIGVSAARNMGLEQVATKYIAFLDSDDVWSPKKLLTQVAIATNSAHESLIISSGATIINSLGELQGIRSHQNAQSFRDLFVRNPIILSSAFISQQQAEHFECSFPNCKHEDFVFWVMLMKGGYKHYYLDQELVKYRVHKSSLTANKFKSLLWHYKALRFVGLNVFESIYFVVRNLSSKIREFAI